MKIFFVLLLTITCCKISTAQFYLTPALGYQLDVNNQFHFNQAAAGLDFTWKINRRYELIFQAQRVFSKAYHFTDSSFTANPQLPLYEPAVKILNVSRYSFSIGQRIGLYSWRTRNHLNILLYLGVGNETVSVGYQYDKNNYTILNPDQSVKAFGLYLASGLEYLHYLPFGRLIVQFGASFTNYSKEHYPNSFKPAVPLSLNIGYSIPLKFYTHENK